MYTILIVDDETIEREGLRYLVESHKYPFRVIEATDGEEAIDVICNEQVDVVITDIRMPFVDGLELARRIYMLERDIIVIIYTAYSEFDYARQALTCGVTDYLLKPLQRTAFFDRMDTVVRTLDSRRVKQKVIRQIDNIIMREKVWYDVIHGNISDDEFAANAKRYGLTDKPILSYVRFYAPLSGIALDWLQKEVYVYAQGVWLMDECSMMMLIDGAETIRQFADGRKVAILDAIGRELMLKITDSTKMQSALLLTAPFGLEDNETRFDCRLLKQKWNQLRLDADIYPMEQGGVYELDADGRDMKNNLIDRLDKLHLDIVRLLRSGDNKDACARMDAFASILRTFSGSSVLYMRYMAADIISCVYEVSVGHHGEMRSRPFELARIFTLMNTGAIADAILECEAKLLGDASTNDTDVINMLVTNIHMHYNSQLTLDSLAKSVYMSPSYVSYLFKRKMGVTLSKYIADYRMEQAAQLLINTSKTITDISQMVGYDNVSYFGYIFKARFGMPPAKYRSALKEGQ